MTKIDRIKQACRLAIELGEKAVRGPWNYVVDGCEAELHNEFGLFAAMGNCEKAHDDSRFIAHARTFAPAAARALLANIDMLQAIARPALGGKLQQYSARDALTAIEASFPDLP